MRAFRRQPVPEGEGSSIEHTWSFQESRGSLMTEAEEIRGRCLCGDVTYVAAGPVVARGQCWCRDCQYLAAGNASANAMVASAGLKVTGELSEVRTVSDSGNDVVRSFCATCGTHLFGASTLNPDFTVIRAGTLDDRSIARPDVIAWTASAPTWARFGEQIPCFAGQPTRPFAAAADNPTPEHN
jgi:hypothetical protein